MQSSKAGVHSYYKTDGGTGYELMAQWGKQRGDYLVIVTNPINIDHSDRDVSVTRMTLAQTGDRVTESSNHPSNRINESMIKQEVLQKYYILACCILHLHKKKVYSTELVGEPQVKVCSKAGSTCKTSMIVSNPKLGPPISTMSDRICFSSEARTSMVYCRDFVSCCK